MLLCPLLQETPGLQTVAFLGSRPETMVTHLLSVLPWLGVDLSAGDTSWSFGVTH